jgi:hypothetical protein
VHNRTNQIPMAGDHFDAFYDNIRPDSQQDLSRAVEADHGQALDDDSFRDAPALDFHLRTPTDPGPTLEALYAQDLDSKTRAEDGSWDRGAIEYEQ